MTLIHLVRHGETTLNADDRYSGRAEATLTEAGRRQAIALAAWAAPRPISRIVSSPASRAMQTAAPAANVVGLRVVVDPRWREVDFGQAEGLRRTELIARYPEEYARFVAKPADVPLPDGESGQQAILRQRDAIADAARYGPDVLIVGHSTAFRLLLCDLLGIDPNRYRTVFPHLRNGGVTTLEIVEGAVALRCLNAPAIAE